MTNNLLLIPYKIFNNDWDLLQKFINKIGNPNYGIIGDVNLSERNDIFSIKNLVKIYGNLDLYKSSITNLGNLEYVSDNLYLVKSSIISLGCLKYVGGMLNLCNTQIDNLGQLELVGKHLATYNSNILPEQINLINIKGKIIT